MASDANKRHNGTAVDRISTLPRNLIELILQCLPICDAARTSMLSRTWRDMWETLPQLVFNDEFFANMVSKYDKNVRLFEVLKTITSILFVHSGPILNFHLSIPRALPLHQSRDMYLWIKNISKNGVRKLELLNDNYNTPIAYNMPSHLFSCLELTHLKLTHCVLNPPLRFGGFCNLIRVKLEWVTITADMSFGAQLEELDLQTCTGIEHLGCQFKCNNNLTTLIIGNCTDIDWRWFRLTHKVQVLRLWFVGFREDGHEINEEVINLEELVGYMPEIRQLLVDDFLLQFLKPGAANSLKLTTSMENLNHLTLCRIEFYNLHHIQYLLCLIQSSPNLRYLEIQVDSEENILNVEEVEQYLLLLDISHMLAGQLEIVRIEEMKGSKVELQFVKLLLASTPLLRWMELEHTLRDPEEELRISQELLQFPRASTTASVIWSYDLEKINV